MNRHDVSTRLSQKVLWVLRTYLNGEIDRYNLQYHPSGDFTLPYPVGLSQSPSAPLGNDGLYPRVSVFPSSTSVTYDAANTTHDLATRFGVVVIFDRTGYNEDFNLTHAQALCEMVSVLLERYLPEGRRNSVCYKTEGTGIAVQAARVNGNVDVILATTNVTAFSRPDLVVGCSITPELGFEPHNPSIPTESSVSLSVTDSGGTGSLSITNGTTVSMEGYTGLSAFSIEGELTDVPRVMVVNQTRLISTAVEYDAVFGGYNLSSIDWSDGDTITASWLANNGLLFSFTLSH